MNFELIRCQGHSAREYANQLAQLRLNVFFEYPYLYEGTQKYEKKYLETYFKAKYSFILLVKSQGQIVGATTAIWTDEEEESFKRPFEDYGINPKDVFYFGESVLDKNFRGLGIGKIFFEERERFAKSLGFIKTLSFCAVERPKEHPLKPQDYRPLDTFWNSQGFQKAPGLTTSYEWQDRDEKKPTAKTMQFWIKHI